MDRAMWPHRDYALDLSGAWLPVGMTVSVDGEVLRVIEWVGPNLWRVRPTIGRSAFDGRYRRRQRNRARRRR